VIGESLLTQTVTIKRRTASTPDIYNQPTWTESSTDVPAYVEPIGATEAGVVGVGTHRAFFKPDTAISAEDLVVVDGTPFEVLGIPGRQPNFLTGAIDHIEVYLVEVSD